MSRPAQAAARAGLAGGLLAALFCAGAAVSPAPAQEAAPAKAPVPDFSSGNTGWVFNYFNQDVEPLPTAERPDF
jgi:hypothetical protein